MNLIKYIPLLLLAVCLQACGDGVVKNKSGAVEPTVQQAVQPVDRKVNHVLQVEYPEDLIGDWVGMFEADTAGQTEHADDDDFVSPNKINISIDEINGNKVNGHSVVAGNYRLFSGEVEDEEKKFVFTVKEAGDDPYDGSFSFTIHKGDSLLTGTWKSYKPVKVPLRTYTLSKKFFKYNPSVKLNDFPFVNWDKKSTVAQEIDGEKFVDTTYYTTTADLYKFNPSRQELDRNKVANMKKPDIYILRNSIFAKHGFSFKDKQLRNFFDNQDWYIPVSTNIESELTALEKKNISLLMKYEQHAAEYYDVFGR